MDSEKKNHRTSKYSTQDFELLKKQRKIPKEYGLETVSDDRFFGKTPQPLSRDPKIPLQAKGLFALCHTFCPEKDLTKECVTNVSLTTLAKYSSLHPTNVHRHLKILHDAGWASVIRRGQNKTNLIHLHGRKRRR
jgi:hypothetical protein